MIYLEALYRAIGGVKTTSYAGGHFDEGIDFCPFIESGSTVITWGKGASAPAWPFSAIIPVILKTASGSPENIFWGMS